MLDSLRAAGAYGVGSGTELPLDLAALRLDADAPECRGDEIQALRVSFVEPVTQVFYRKGQRERKRAPVRRDGSPAGVAYQHGEAELCSSLRSLRETGEPRLLPRGPDVARGGPDQDRRTTFARRNLLQHGLLQPEADFGIVEGFRDQDLHALTCVQRIIPYLWKCVSRPARPTHVPDALLAQLPSVRTRRRRIALLRRQPPNPTAGMRLPVLLR